MAAVNVLQTIHIEEIAFGDVHGPDFRQPLTAKNFHPQFDNSYIHNNKCI